ncbi:hypothetical protein PM082_011110 [Marasmius tenuissimus]|nr:hypothetical protein PM082_011110 [Marasmius tenuissimus]
MDTPYITPDEFIAKTLHAPNLDELNHDGDINHLREIIDSSEFQKRLRRCHSQVNDEEQLYSMIDDLTNHSLEELKRKRLTKNKLMFTFCVNSPTLAKCSQDAPPGIVDAIVRTKPKWKGKRRAKKKAAKYKKSLSWSESLTFLKIQTESSVNAQPPCENDHHSERYGDVNAPVSPTCGCSAAPSPSHHPLQYNRTSASSNCLSSGAESGGPTYKRTRLDMPQRYRPQCAKYAMCILNRSGIRTHVIGGLIVGDRMELVVYTHTGPSISTSFSFIYDSLTFLRVILAYSKMTLAQWGVTDVPECRTMACATRKRLFKKQVKLNHQIIKEKTFKVDGSTFKAKIPAVLPWRWIKGTVWTVEVEVLDGPVHDKACASGTGGEAHQQGESVREGERGA